MNLIDAHYQNSTFLYDIENDEELKLLKEQSKTKLVLIVSHNLVDAEEYADRIIELYDGIILPVETGPATYLDSSKNTITKEMRILKDHLSIGNLGGFPSITIPSGFVNNMPVGLNITGKCYDDANILNIAYALENSMPYKNQIAKEVSHD